MARIRQNDEQEVESGGDDRSEDTSQDEGSESGSGEDSDVEPVEMLALGRSRRATAGNRLSTLLDQEGGDEDMDLLFAENGEEEDIDFEVKDADAAALSDEGGGNSSSSSEDEQQGQDDELAGERELEKQQRAAQRVQKRKADKAIIRPPKAPKRVKIDDAAKPDNHNPSTRSTQPAAAPRPKKKSDRVFNPTEAATRASSRTLAIQNKRRTQASIKESEVRRKRQIATMEAAQKKKDASRVRPMTQEERLEEAAKTERHNSKSLNTWEEAEKERLKRQRAKLEAMQNRTLQGPVIRWWSGPAEWVGDKLFHVGKRSKVEIVSDKNETEGGQGNNASPDVLQSSAEHDTIVLNGVSEENADKPDQRDHDPDAMRIDEPSVTGGVDNSKGDATVLLDGIDFYASMPEKDDLTQPTPSTLPEPSHTLDAVNAETSQETVNNTASTTSADQLSLSLQTQDKSQVQHPSPPSTTNSFASAPENPQSASPLPAQTSEDQPAANPTPAPASASAHPTYMPQSQPQQSQQLHPQSQHAAPTLTSILNPTNPTPLTANASPTTVVAHNSTILSNPSLPLPPHKHPEPALPPPPKTTSQRTHLTLLNFPTIPPPQQKLTAQAHSNLTEMTRRILFNWSNPYQSKPVRITKPACAVTGDRAIYKDPETGLRTRDLQAWKTGRWCRRSGWWAGASESTAGTDEAVDGSKGEKNPTKDDGYLRWSTLVGAYVGSEESPAKGAPAGFSKHVPTVESADAAVGKGGPTGRPATGMGEVDGRAAEYAAMGAGVPESGKGQGEGSGDGVLLGPKEHHSAAGMTSVGA